FNFNCEHNLLSSLPPLSTTNLVYLNCRYNNIISFPAPFPGTLEQLDCSHNKLTNLPSISYLQYLDCSYNNLNSLCTTMYGIQYLFCDSNHLTSLPVLPNTLVNLDCGLNQLTSLPALPNSLGALGCYSNSLTSLPTLPDSLQFLSCSYNNISCMPNFPGTLTDSMQFYIDPNPYTCLPNYVTAMGVTDLAKPLCTAGNPNGCFIAGIEKTNFKTPLSIYPSPAQNNFTIETNFADKQVLQLFDVNGKLVLVQSITSTTTIDVSYLNAGVYSLAIVNSQNIQSKKLVIVK
ncbi:MAG TPA: T9SS type A sorting domain-containing protein, partial [Bacteroidia bacterium]|nr:T9SS type A sorting domain-containing protein [Bacteroidia bacterium]